MSETLEPKYQIGEEVYAVTTCSPVSVGDKHIGLVSETFSKIILVGNIRYPSFGYMYLVEFPSLVRDWVPETLLSKVDEIEDWF